MRIRVIFTDPTCVLEPEQHLSPNEKIILIKDPYSISMVDDARSIVGLNGAISYEQYCIELRNIISNTIRSQRLEEINACDSIVVESCKEPPNFEVLMTVLADVKVPLSNNCHLLFKNCAFSGTLYVNAVLNFVRSFSGKAQPIHFYITIDQEKLSPSEHDKAKLSMLNNVTFFPDADSYPVIRRFTDDQFIEEETKKRTLETSGKKQRIQGDDELSKDFSLSRLSNPTYFFRSQVDGKLTPRNLLMNFFSQAHQQRSDYTCGPATLKMVANYYTSLGSRSFCGKPIADHQATVKKTNGKVITAPVWNIVDSFTESELAERVKTTEEVGSDIAEMRKGLLELGLHVIDDCDGINADEHNEVALKAHKEKVWNKIQEVFNLGIPVIFNLRDRFETGHYEVGIGIDNNHNIILAEPGTALTGKVEFETVPKEQFIVRWKNMSGKLHGRFLIVPPNEAAAQKIEAIFNDLPHYYNGQAINRNMVADQCSWSAKK